MNKTTGHRLLTLLAATLMLTSGNALAKRKPKIQTGPDAEISFDGLHRVDRVAVDEAWVKPDIDLSRYQKIMLVSLGIHYRDVKAPPTRTYRGRSSDAFPVSERQKKKVSKIVSDAFKQELRKVERFEFVKKPGPDTMIITGAIIDVVSRVPPEPIGRSAIYLTEVGDATLVLEIHDSMSNEILARVVDRRSADSVRAFDAHSVSTWQEVRQLARSWAVRLRKRLNEVDSAYEE